VANGQVGDFDGYTIRIVAPSATDATSTTTTAEVESGTTVDNNNNESALLEGAASSLTSSSQRLRFAVDKPSSQRDHQFRSLAQASTSSRRKPTPPTTARGSAAKPSPSYGFVPIVIEEAGALGINVKHAPLPPVLQAALQVYTGRAISPADSSKSMLVTSFKKEMALAKRNGVKAGDWVFLAAAADEPQCTNNHHPAVNPIRSIAYDEVAATMKAGTRPLLLVIGRDANLHGRKTVSPNENNDTSNTNGEGTGGAGGGGNGRENRPDRRPPSDNRPSNNGNNPSSNFRTQTATTSQNQQKQSTMLRIAFAEKPAAASVNFRPASLNPLAAERPTLTATKSKGNTQPTAVSRRTTAAAAALPLPTFAVRPSVKHLRLSDADKPKLMPSPLSSPKSKSADAVAAAEEDGRQQQQRQVAMYSLSQTKMSGKPASCDTAERSSSTATSSLPNISTKDKPTGGLSQISSKCDSTAPFCLACSGSSGKTNAFHHSWCPNHPLFSLSGAAEIYDRIVSGRRVNCSACEKEFQSGRKCNESHSDACRTLEKAKTAIPREGPDLLVMDATDTFSDLDDAVMEAEDDELSEYQVPTNDPGRKFNKLSLVENSQSTSKKDANSKNASTVDKTKKPAPNDATKNQHAKSTKDNKIKKVEKKATISKNSSPKRGTGTVELHKADASTIIDKHTDSWNAAQPKKGWNSSIDPWGPAGHLLDDCIVLSPEWNGAHHDYLIPTPRYAFDPFATDAYKETHRNPVDYGFHVVSLARDPLGTLPWGFSVKRHDFGGACIISAVEPLSPASSAVRTFVPLHRLQTSSNFQWFIRRLLAPAEKYSLLLQFTILSFRSTASAWAECRNLASSFSSKRVAPI
jgi:hypothetical protein